MQTLLSDSTRFDSRKTLLICLGVVLGSAIFLAPVTAARADSSHELSFSPALDKGLLGEGRQAYRERANPDRAQDAYVLLKQNLEENPGDPIAAWHFSLSCYYVGKRVLSNDSDARKRIHQEGRDAAERALKEDPECGPCHLLSAINHALWAEEIGILRTIMGLPKVLGHLKRAAKLDPHFGGAAALRVHAMILKVVPQFFGGGKQKARRMIEEAIQVAPAEPLNYEILADILIEKYKDPEGALAVAERGLLVPTPGPEYVESRDSIDYLKRVVERYDQDRVPSGS